MGPRISSSLERLRASLWFIPLAGLVLAVSMAIATVWLDATTQLAVLANLVTDDAESARAILSVIATSMLTFTALVFTITIVVLQLAASHYSPRITRAFLRERQTKLTLALFLGTFTYSLLVLRTVRTLDGGFVPTLSIGVTYLLVFASLVTFVFYLDHVSQSIRASNIVRRLAREGLETLERCTGDARDELPVVELPMTDRVAWHGEGGVLAYIDEDGLAARAARHGVVVVVLHAIGDFVPHGAPILELRGGRYAPAGAARDEICDHLSIGADRTPQQDLGLAIRHLVDVALRALSPGIHDPTTAVQALDYVHDLLRRMARAALPPHTVVGPDGAVRLVVPRLSWDALLVLALSELRAVAADHVQVSRRVLHMLEDLMEIAPDARRAAVAQHRRRWLHTAQRDLGRHPDPAGLGAAV